MIVHSSFQASGTVIKVLVVDDSVVIRRIVSEALSGDPQIHVVGTASNGVIALQRIRQLNPDVVTLDVEMPEMDGIETLRHIRKDFPDIQVIMFSTLTERGASITIDALALGARDYLTKPSGSSSPELAFKMLKKDLLVKVKQFLPSVVPDVPAKLDIPTFSQKKQYKGPRQAVVIGVSTGGPNALSTILPEFPSGFHLPVLIVQHMPPIFTRLLAERLQSMTTLQVREARDEEPVNAGEILIAPGDHHLQVRKTAEGVVTELNQAPHENSCRPAVDVLFRSAAQVWGGAVVAVVMTGMGQDGLRGIESLSQQGAHVIAQDEQSSVVWGMPGYVARSGLADSVLPLTQVVPEILRIV